MSANYKSKSKVQSPKFSSLVFGLWPLDYSRMATRRVLSGALLVATTGGMSGCEWFTDFKRQPHVVTWESWRPDSLGVRGSPQGSVPTDGTAMASWMVSYTPSIAAIDSLAGIVNPVAVTEASLTAG